MKARQRLACFVAFVLLLTMTAFPAAAEDATLEDLGFHETGYPVVDQPVTLTVFGSRDQNQAEWKDVRMLNASAEKAGITFDWQEVPAQGFAEKKNLMFAGNDLPDVFLRCGFTVNEIIMYGVTSQQLIPLDDLIAQYAPNLSKIYEEHPEIRQALTAPDGQMYTIPHIDLSDTGKMGFKQWINKDWLEAVGKEVPTTLEELKDVLIAFRDGDPNGNGQADEIPLGIREPSSVYTLGGSFGLQYQMKDTYNIDENGQLHNWLCDDEFKEYLMFLNDLYEEGLLWVDYYKNDRPAWRSNLSNALFGVMYMPYSDVFLNVEDQYVGFEPLVGPHGDQLWVDATAGISSLGSFAISNTCKYPEIAIRWVDQFFTEEGAIEFCYGVEGETYYVDENGQPRFVDEILNAPEGFMTAMGKLNLVPGGDFPRLTTNLTDGVVASDLTKEVAALLVPFLPETVVLKPAVSIEDMDMVNMISQDLTTYRDTAVTNFILGEWDFDMWEEYCATLEQIGIRELEAIYQRALDAAAE